MEVIHIVSGNDNLFPDGLQFVRRGDEYAVVDIRSKDMTNWMSPYEAIKWAFIPSAMEPCHRMDKFIKGYFPESLVILAALEIT